MNKIMEMDLNKLRCHLAIFKEIDPQIKDGQK